METLFLWIYIITLALLINHEIDSAYWNEWKLFNLKGGVDGFLWVHIPLWIISLWGLTEIHAGTMAGMIVALIVSTAGIGCFSIHSWFISKGHKEFTTAISRFHLWAILIFSIDLLGLSIYFLSS